MRPPWESVEEVNMRRLIAFGALVALLVGLMAAPVVAVPPPNLHCPSGWDYKVEATDSELDDVVLPAGTVFCIKAGNGNTGELVADGQMTLFEILEYEGFVNSGGQTPSVSYYVVYDEYCSGYYC